METGVILYFKKAKNAFVAATGKGKVLLPLPARQTLEGGQMRELRFSEPRLKPKQKDPVVFLEVEEKDSVLSAKAWALAQA